jgi:uncharacterized YccA/Bax inhibitor family protein
MRTSNPTLSASTLQSVRGVAGAEAMTIQGAINKTAILLGLLLVAAAWTWSSARGTGVGASPWIMGGAIGGFIVAMVTIFKKEWAGITAPLYAILEGLFLGGISVVFEAQYPGIVIQAVFLTSATLLTLLFAYRSGVIRVTDKFRLGVVAATGGIAIVYFVSIILGFFKVHVPLIYSNGIFGIGFSVFVVIIAALNLVLDFDLIESAASQGAPKYFEWYGAFALMVTLVWLYLEILRLMSKLRSRN